MHRRNFLHIAAAFFASAALQRGPAAWAALQPVEPERSAFKILHVFPHDPQAFTQGLLYHDGLLYESTGGFGTSSIRQVELETGKVLQKRDLGRTYFGEGLALWDDRLIQLTWRSGTGFVYDLERLELVDDFAYPGEGWGLTEDDDSLIMSDGSSQLRRLDPHSYAETRRLTVHEQGRAQAGLNELEYINGEIWANVYPTKRVVRINPGDGSVTGSLDLTGILGVRRRVSPDAVANGIAFDPHGERIFVTGKLWPVLFEIALKPVARGVTSKEG